MIAHHDYVQMIMSKSQQLTVAHANGHMTVHQSFQTVREYRRIEAHMELHIPLQCLVTHTLAYPKTSTAVVTICQNASETNSVPTRSDMMNIEIQGTLTMAVEIVEPQVVADLIEIITTVHDMSAIHPFQRLAAQQKLIEDLIIQIIPQIFRHVATVDLVSTISD